MLFRSDHGAGAVHVVSVDRPESAEVREEYLRCDGGGFCEGDAEDLLHAEDGVTCDAASDEIREERSPFGFAQGRLSTP